MSAILINVVCFKIIFLCFLLLWKSSLFWVMRGINVWNTRLFLASWKAGLSFWVVSPSAFITNPAEARFLAFTSPNILCNIPVVSEGVAPMWIRVPDSRCSSGNAVKQLEGDLSHLKLPSAKLLLHRQMILPLCTITPTLWRIMVISCYTQYSRGAWYQLEMLCEL